MITGDNHRTAEAIAAKDGVVLSTVVANGLRLYRFRQSRQRSLDDQQS